MLVGHSHQNEVELVLHKHMQNWRQLSLSACRHNRFCYLHQTEHHIPPNVPHMHVDFGVCQ